MAFEFLKKGKVTSFEVQGEQVNFRGIPLGTIFKIRNLVEGQKAASKLLTTLFTDTTKDSGIKTVTKLVDADKVLYDTEQTIVAIDPNIAAMRVRDKEQGIEGLIKLLTSPESEDLLAEIIIHSAECFDAKDMDGSKEAVAGLELPVVIELVIGSLKASSGVVSVLGKLFPQMSKSVAAKVDQVLGKMGD